MTDPARLPPRAPGTRRRQTYRIAAVQFQCVDLLASDQLLNRSRLGLQASRPGRDLHRFGRRANCEDGVQTQLRCRVQFVVAGFKFLETATSP